MIGRSVRRSLRDPEAFFTALMLPVILMLLFVYVFGGALHTGTTYVDYVVPGLIVLCAGFGAGTTATAVAQDMSNGIVDRFRSMPVSPTSVLTGHVIASLLRNLLATALVIAVGLAVGWRPSGSAADWVAARSCRALHPDAVVAGSGRGPRCPQPRSCQQHDHRADVPALREHGVRAGLDDAAVDARVRRAPADDPGDRDVAWTVDGHAAGPPAALGGALVPGLLVVSIVAATLLFARRTSRLDSLRCRRVVEHRVVHGHVAVVDVRGARRHLRQPVGTRPNLAPRPR